MRKRKPAAKSATMTATRRREELEAVSGVERKKPVPPAPPEKGRAGRKGVVIYLDPLAKKVLADLAHEQRKSLQELGLEAFNHLFRAYGQKPIA